MNSKEDSNELIKEFRNNLKDFLKDFKNMDKDSSKNINFLFGAGFNKNISNNADLWDDLVFKSLLRYIEFHKIPCLKTISLTKEIIGSSSGKKLALSISSDENIKFEEIELNDSDFRFKIQEDLKGIKERFSVIFYTLNYDRNIEKILDIDSCNLLKDGEVDSEKVNHFHGVIDYNGKISNEKLLTLKDYLSWVLQLNCL